VSAAGVAHAEGRIGLYRDLDMGSCGFVDASPGIITVYVMQTGASANGSEFQLVPGQGATLTYLAETIPVGFAGAMGRSDAGIAIAYGGCHAPPIHVLTVFYESFGLSGTCGGIAILNNPESSYQLDDHVAYVNCSAEPLFAEAGHAVVNPDESCECGSDPGGGQTPVETATWGKVKALYVN